MATRDRVTPHAAGKAWAWIAGFVIVGFGVGVVLTLQTAKVYRASAQLYVAQTNETSNNTFVQVQMQLQSLATIADSPRVTAPVIASLRLKISQEELAAKITTDVPKDEVLVNMHVTDSDATMAARLTNAVAVQFIRVVEEVWNGDGKRTVGLSVVHPATVPDNPISNHWMRNVGLGVLAGLLLGFVVVGLRFHKQRDVS